jgi:CheY-like chemotaxis protein
VLVAEDNRVNRFILAKFLQKWGARFDTAEDGTEALALIEQNDYHVVLLDLQMPGLSGFEVASRARNLPGEKYRSLPIIALSASSRTGLEERLAAAGITDFVGKPFEPAELLAKIAAYTRNESAAPGENPGPEAHVEPEAAPPGGAVPGKSPITLNNIIALTENNPEDLLDLVQLSMDELLHYKGEFGTVLTAGDAYRLERLAHRSKVTINLLEAKRLEALIGQAQRQLYEERDLAARQALASAIAAEVDVVVDQLKQFVHPTP